LGFWAAIQFLTIFPTPLHHDVDDQRLGESLTYFPLVGLILGAILFGLQYGLNFLLPAPVTSALLVMALVILTGAHHLDGLIDTCDGVFAGKTAKQRLRIMADTQVGTFGIAGAILVLLLKYACLSSYMPMLPALLLLPTLGRWGMVVAIFTFPYAKTSGMGLAFKQGATWQRLAIATAIALVTAFLLLQWKGVLLMTLVYACAFGIGIYLNSRLRGLTGDTYGAINELVEALVLLLVIVLWRM
jgi:adenosylcobinamide-GDP ribazoletransferase